MQASACSGVVMPQTLIRIGLWAEAGMDFLRTWSYHISFKNKTFRQTLNGKMEKGPSFQWRDSTLMLQVRVQPRARKSEWNGLKEGLIQLRLNALPVENQANEECVRFLAEAFQTSVSRVKIVRGHKARLKSVVIEKPDRVCWQKLLKSEFASN